MRAYKLSRQVRKIRTAVSSEANTRALTKSKPINMRKTVKKPEGVQMKIKFYFSNSFLFRDFQEEDLDILIDSMVE